MGAHSGWWSDDMIIMIGFGNKNKNTFFSYNKERHGIKTMSYPELKTELALTFHYRILHSHTLFLSMEYEKINNFGYVSENFSESKLVWLGYSFSINFK